MKKGLELPINMIIVIAVAVLVLFVVAAFFSSRLGGGQIDINREQALSEACQKALTVGGCSLSTSINLKYDDPVLGQKGSSVTLSRICQEKNLDTTGGTSSECARRCGCA